MKLNKIPKTCNGVSYLKMGGASSAKSQLNIPSTTWQKIVTSLTTSFRGHGEEDRGDEVER